MLEQGVTPPQVQDPTLALVELHLVPLCPTVPVSLNGTFWSVSCYSQLCVVAKGSLYPFLPIIDG